MGSQTWPNADPVYDEIELSSPEGSNDAENIDAETVRARRFSTPTEIGLMRFGQDDDFCRIRNISTTGLMAQVYRTISVGDEVRVALKTGQSVKGRVVWAVEHIPDLGSRSVRQIGVSFDEPIDIKPVVSSHSSLRPACSNAGPGSPPNVLSEWSLTAVAKFPVGFATSRSVVRRSALPTGCRGKPRAH